MRLREQDLDALRKGIAEQERQRIEAESIRRDFERRLGRTPVKDARVVLARELIPGDVLVSCEWGVNFYAHGTVTGVNPDREGLRDGDVWVEYKTDNGGTGGSTYKLDDPVLVER